MDMEEIVIGIVFIIVVGVMVGIVFMSIVLNSGENTVVRTDDLDVVCEKMYGDGFKYKDMIWGNELDIFCIKVNPDVIMNASGVEINELSNK